MKGLVGLRGIWLFGFALGGQNEKTEIIEWEEIEHEGQWDVAVELFYDDFVVW